MIYTAFLHSCKRFTHHRGKKKVKERFKKKEKRKNKVTKNLLQGDSNPDPQNQLELKVNASILLYGD